MEDCLQNECKGMKIEAVSADHQNKADIAAGAPASGVDRDKVDAMVDLTNSAGALAVQKLIKEKGGIAMYSGLPGHHAPDQRRLRGKRLPLDV